VIKVISQASKLTADTQKNGETRKRVQAQRAGWFLKFQKLLKDASTDGETQRDIRTARRSQMSYFILSEKGMMCIIPDSVHVAVLSNCSI
jgi:hypothetical protein